MYLTPSLLASHENIRIQHRGSLNMLVTCFIIPSVLFYVSTSCVLPFYRPIYLITELLVLALIKICYGHGRSGRSGRSASTGHGMCVYPKGY